MNTKIEKIIEAHTGDDGCLETSYIDELKARLDTYREIHDELVTLCEEWIIAFGWHGSQVHDVTINVFSEAYPPYVIANYTYYTIDSEYGDNYREGQEKIPLSIFWDDDCVTKEKKKRFEKQMEEMKKREERKKVQDMKDKATRYEKYLTLKAEFGNEED